MRARLQQAADSAVRAVDDPPEVSDFKDLAGHEANDAMHDAAAAQALQELAAIEAALGRVREGSYGLCEECDEPIAPARLLAVPAATFCADCQRQREYGPAHAG